MTCREKLIAEHPDWDDAKINDVITHYCPWSYRYLDMPVWCIGYDEINCATCWNRKIDKLVKLPGHPHFTVEAGKAFKKMSEGISKAKDSVDQLADTLRTIKDSGDRTQFETGAVRDMHEGKGRCDLLPLEVVAEIYHKFSDEDPDVCRLFDHIANFKRSNNTDYLYQALDDCDVFPGWETMLLEVAKHFEEGAKKYDENNWQKGIPVKFYIDSGIRHYLKWLRGDKDEPHDRAFVWNIMCCIWEVDYSPRAEGKDSHEEA